MQPISQTQPAPLGNLQELRFTPFLDLFFVLLIAFLLLAPFLVSESAPGKSAEVSATTMVAARPSQVFALSIDQRGVVSFAGQQVEGDSLRDRMESLVESNPSVGVVIRSSKQLPVEELVKVMNAVKSAGVIHVGITTE